MQSQLNCLSFRLAEEDEGGRQRKGRKRRTRCEQLSDIVNLEMIIMKWAFPVLTWLHFSLTVVGYGLIVRTVGLF